MSQIPPTSPVEIPPPAEPPKWPGTVGVISIVWASLGMLCGVCGPAALLLMPMLMKKAEDQNGPYPPELLPSKLQVALSFTGLPIAILLLWAGIATLRRQRSGRPLHLVYAIISLGLAIAATAAGVVHMQEQHEFMAHNASNAWVKNMPKGADIGGLIFGIVVGTAYPLFALVWFTLPKHSPEIGAPEEMVI